jgi:hypothetical protein
MSVLAPSGAEELTGAARRRGIAISNINWFRAVAWKALRDGGPKAELRAANARTAARIVLKQARRDALVTRMTTDALAGTVRPRSAVSAPPQSHQSGRAEASG